MFRFTVNKYGSVIECNIAESSLNDSEVENSVLNIISGMNFGKVQQLSDVSFFYPIEFLPAWSFYSGLLVQDLTPEIKKTFSGLLDAGVMVYATYQGSPAEAAGIKRGDIIVEVGGFPVRHLDGFLYAIQAGDITSRETEVVVYRLDKKISFKLVRDIYKGRPPKFLERDYSHNRPSVPAH